MTKQFEILIVLLFICQILAGSYHGQGPRLLRPGPVWYGKYLDVGLNHSNQFDYNDREVLKTSEIRNSDIGTSSLKNPIVTIKDGSLRGFIMKTIKNRDIEAFRGIPFAEPPLGNLRFRLPQKNRPWNGIRNAIAESPECIQLDMMQNWQVHGEEDCLYLNVYRPTRSQDKSLNFNLLPVMVWFHSGGFFFGSGKIYGPAYLLDRDIILVTVNFRLGAFGFLSTGDDACPGNMGMKDQVMALKWVQENILSFGGNPNSVTLFGQSAGGASVHYHMISQMSQGLFHRGISQSGTALQYWSLQRHPESYAKQIGQLLNCTGAGHFPSSSYEMIECLRNIDANLLAPIQRSLFQWDAYPVSVFRPVIEHNPDGAFLTETPEESYLSRKVRPTPWLTGLTKNELSWIISGLVPNETLVHDVNTDWDRVCPIFFDLIEESEWRNVEVCRKVWQYYMGNEKLSFTTRMKFVDLYGDRFFNERGMQAIRYHSVLTGAPVYSYRFSFEGKYSTVQRNGQNPRDWGVAHLDDLIYLFNITEYHPTLKTTDTNELKMSEMMITLWTNFATYGRPYFETENVPVDLWQPVQNENIFSPVQMLDLNLTPKMIQDPFYERYLFWRGLKLRD